MQNPFPRLLISAPLCHSPLAHTDIAEQLEKVAGGVLGFVRSKVEDIVHQIFEPLLGHLGIPEDLAGLIDVNISFPDLDFMDSLDAELAALVSQTSGLVDKLFVNDIWTGIDNWLTDPLGLQQVRTLAIKCGPDLVDTTKADLHALKTKLKDELTKLKAALEKPMCQYKDHRIQGCTGAGTCG